MFSCLFLAVFPLLPVVGREPNINYVWALFVHLLSYTITIIFLLIHCKKHICTSLSVILNDIRKVHLLNLMYCTAEFVLGCWPSSICPHTSVHHGDALLWSEGIVSCSSSRSFLPFFSSFFTVQGHFHHRNFGDHLNMHAFLDGAGGAVCLYRDQHPLQSAGEARPATLQPARKLAHTR